MFTGDKIRWAWPPNRLGLPPLPCSRTAMAPYISILFKQERPVNVNDPV